MSEKPLSPHHIIIRFGSGIPIQHRGPVMMAMERTLRELGIPAEVFLQTMLDDSKLRNMMSIDERAKL